jgi:small-conductance mechanosensitive channel
LTDNLIIIPNAKLADVIITNYNLPRNDLSVRVPVGVSYESDLEKVERVTLEVAAEVQASVEGAEREWAPRLRFSAFGASSVELFVVLRAVAPEAQFLLVHEFIKRLSARYAREGIEIPYPAQNVYLRTPVSLVAEEGKR